MSAYSLDYIGSWLRHLSVDEAKRSRDTIQRTVERLITALDAEFKKAE